MHNEPRHVSNSDRQVVDSYNQNTRIQARISLVHSPVFVCIGIVFVLVAFVGIFIFGSYAASHWKSYLGQTASWVSWCIWFIAATGTIGLIYLATRVANSGADALGKIGHTCIDIYRSISEAKGQRERNKPAYRSELCGASGTWERGHYSDCH